MTNDEIVQAIAARKEGMHAADIRKLLRYAQTTKLKRLGLLCKTGLIVKTGQSRALRWCTPENVQSALAFIAANRSLRDTERRREYEARRSKNRKRKSKTRVEAIQQAVEVDDMPILQVVIKAEEARPLAKTAPSSVWELGA